MPPCASSSTLPETSSMVTFSVVICRALRVQFAAASCAPPTLLCYIIYSSALRVTIARRWH
jgi:hypothetical protein